MQLQAQTRAGAAKSSGPWYQVARPPAVTDLPCCPLLRAGLDLPHDCKLGVCMTCPAKLLSGKVDQSGSMLSEDVAEKGYALLCVAQPQSDCRVKTISEVCTADTHTHAHTHTHRGRHTHTDRQTHTHAGRRARTHTHTRARARARVGADNADSETWSALPSRAAWRTHTDTNTLTDSGALLIQTHGWRHGTRFGRVRMRFTATLGVQA